MCGYKRCTAQTCLQIYKILDQYMVRLFSSSKIQRLISQNPISRPTTERRIFEISAEIEQQLLNDSKNCEAFSLALDESTDIQDKPQMSVFVRYVTSDVIVKEE